MLAKADPEFKEDYDAAAKMAQEVAPWLAEQFGRTLAQEKAEMQGMKRQNRESATSTRSTIP